MRGENDAGPMASGTIELRPERQRGLANQIAVARARRAEAQIGREDFMENPSIETPKILEPSHDGFREELRRIIADDAERAANEAKAPAMAQTEPEAAETTQAAETPRRRHSRLKVASYWLGCFLGIGAVAFGLTRTS